MSKTRNRVGACLSGCALIACAFGAIPRLQAQNQVVYDVILRGGTIYNGSGEPPFVSDLGIRADTIAAVGDLSLSHARREVDANGLAVAPGFINMLSWADGSLLKDGRSMSDIKQGVTLEVFGEGLSAGPRIRRKGDTRWRTLGEYFDHLQRKGVSTNFASFVGATTVRDYVLGQQNRKPTPAELERMRILVSEAMQQGAIGLGSALIYAPADYASTEELVELCKVAASYGGMYSTHMRSESDRILVALNETLQIAEQAQIPVEIHHLKITHERNWKKIDTVLAKIDSARRAGLTITANTYTYVASGTGLTARLPTWVQEGGPIEMRKRLRDPVVRKKVLDELRLGIPARNSDPGDVLILGFKSDSLNKRYKGKRLDEITRLHGRDADQTMIDLILADKTSIPSIFFLASEENLRRVIRLPYVSFCSDAASLAAEPPFINDGVHPRAYGSFARLLGKYVREEKLISTAEAVRRLTSLPADNMGIKHRGRLRVGYFADVVVFDPARVIDKATFEDPHRYAEGVVHVFVNGVRVLENGLHTGAKPGRCVRGPGWKKGL